MPFSTLIDRAMPWQAVSANIVIVSLAVLREDFVVSRRPGRVLRDDQLVDFAQYLRGQTFALLDQRSFLRRRSRTQLG